MPRGKVGFPVGVIERDQLAVLDGGVVPETRCVRLTEQDATEPVPLDLGHVTNQTMKRQLRGGHGSDLAAGVIESLTLEQQGRTVKLEPRLEHLPLLQDERGLAATGIVEVLDHGVTLLACSSASLVR